MLLSVAKMEKAKKAAYLRGDQFEYDECVSRMSKFEAQTKSITSEIEELKKELSAMHSDVKARSIFKVISIQFPTFIKPDAIIIPSAKNEPQDERYFKSIETTLY